MREAFLRRVSMRTFVTREDVAGLVVFVCSDAAAKISGQALAVDGHMEPADGLSRRSSVWCVGSAGRSVSAGSPYPSFRDSTIAAAQFLLSGGDSEM